MKRSPLRRKTPLAKVGKQKPKRRKKYDAYLRSKEWREKRAACFTRDGWRCTTLYEIPVTYSSGIAHIGSIHVRCSYVDETHTGKGLHAHHKTYARFGRELPDDLVTLCRRHHDRVESRLRPWNARKGVA